MRAGKGRESRGTARINIDPACMTAAERLVAERHLHELVSRATFLGDLDGALVDLGDGTGYRLRRVARGDYLAVPTPVRWNAWQVTG